MTSTKHEPQKDMMTTIREHVFKSMSEEQRSNFTRLAEKFHQSFDVETQHTREHNVKEIALEECLAYLVESLKSGLHPKHTTKEERGLLFAAYGSQWYQEFGYTRSELRGVADINGEDILLE